MPLLGTLATVAPLISTGANFLSGILGNKSNEDINAHQREWQSAENEKSRNFTAGENSLDRGMQNYWNQKSLDWQEKMWNLQNQYNTPSAMMERYKEAGLNPFLSMASGQSIGAGAGAAGSAGSPSVSAGGSHSTAPMGSVPGAIPMQAPRFDIDALGVSANVANQNARTQQQKWETYQYIRQHVGSDAAKRYLDNNPDMFQSSDPDNDPWMRAYKRSETRENLENYVLDTKSWLLDRYGDQDHLKALQEADARIEDIVSKMNERDANIALLTEQLNTELARQFQLRGSGSESYAKAETESQLRKYLLNKLVLETGLAGYSFMREKSSFDSESELRAWLNSSEGKNAIKEMEQNGLLTNPTLFWRYLYQFLDHLPFAGGASVTKHLK